MFLKLIQEVRSNLLQILKARVIILVILEAKIEILWQFLNKNNIFVSLKTEKILPILELKDDVSYKVWFNKIKSNFFLVLRTRGDILLILKYGDATQLTVEPAAIFLIIF